MERDTHDWDVVSSQPKPGTIVGNPKTQHMGAVDPEDHRYRQDLSVASEDMDEFAEDDVDGPQDSASP